jgi:hypothetical protein
MEWMEERNVSNDVSNTEKLIEQALTRADQIGARAWTELTHYYQVLGIIQIAFGLTLIAILAATVWLFIRKFDKFDDPEMVVVFGGMVEAVVLLIGGWLIAEGSVYLLAPGGSALSRVLN